MMNSTLGPGMTNITSAVAVRAKSWCVAITAVMVRSRSARPRLFRTTLTRVCERGEPVMANSAEGRVALITGASRGIGQAIAVRLAAEGATVAVIGRGENRSTNLAGSLDETVELCRVASGRDPLVVRADIADASADKAALVAD